MVTDIINMLIGVLLISITVIWIVSLVKWDGKGCEPNPDDCSHCPFPCEHNTNKKEN